MPVFETPEPISVTVDLSVGDVQVVASDRTDTSVEVRPSDPSDESDVEAAQKTRVEYADGALLVRGPKRVLDFSRKTRSVDVLIELPTGSKVHSDVSVGGVRGTGVLGECRVNTSAGHVHLDRTGPVKVDTSAGHVTVGEAAGNAEISTGSGNVRVGAVNGSLVVKNSNGSNEIGAVEGEVRVRASNGDITVDRAGSVVEAKSANGSIIVGEVRRDTATLTTAMGNLEVGIAEGTAAWLDVKTGFGKVHNTLDGSDGPGTSAETVKVSAHTSFGDITIRRS